MGNLSTKALALSGALAAVVTAVIKVEKALIDMTKEASEQASQLINLSSAINMTTTEAQKWDYVLRTVGSSLEEAQGDLSMFQERILEAASGEGEAAEMFQKLGITVIDVTTGSLRPASDVLRELIEKLSDMEDVTDRNATSSILLGGTGEKLTAIYDEQVGTLDDLIKKKEENGIVSEEELKILDRTDSALQDLSGTTDTLKKRIASQFSPAMETAMKKLEEFISKVGNALIDTGIVDSMGNILIAAASLLEPLGVLADVILPKLAPILNMIAYPLALLADTATVITGIATFDWDTIRKGLGLDRNSAQAQLHYRGQGFEYDYSTGTWYDPNVRPFDDSDYWSYSNTPTSYSPSSYSYSGGDIYNITIDAKNVREFNDVVEIMKNQRRLGRMYG